MINVLLADDYAIIRKSLQYLLEATRHIAVVGTASNGVEAVAQARLHYPDIAVIDISMPVMDGIEAAKQIRECCPDTRVIIFSMHTSPEYVYRALQAGVFGYIVKDSVFEDLVPAVYALLMGHRYFSKKIEGIARYYLDRKQE